MKKLAVFTMMLIVAFCCAFGLTACGEKANTVGDDAALVINKRYIREYDANNKEKSEQESEQFYYVFYLNGTGELVRHYDYNSSYGDEYSDHFHYSVHFKYTYVDSDKSAVVCFYDSFERLEGDDGKASVSSDWSRLITVSKNLLATTGSGGYLFWINEDYLKTIPNFNVKTDK